MSALYGLGFLSTLSQSYYHYTAIQSAIFSYIEVDQVAVKLIVAFVKDCPLHRFDSFLPKIVFIG